MTSMLGLTADDPSAPLLHILEARGAVPSWHEHTRDWAKRFHASWTTEGWDPKDASIEVISPTYGLGPAAGSTGLRIPANVPVIIRGIVDAVDGALAKPVQPSAPLRLSCEGIQAALDRLSQIIGGIRDTGLPMFPVQSHPWNPATIAATHFCYFHELAHVTFLNRNQFQLHEERWTNEFEADKFGLASLTLSYQSQPQLVESLALGGPVLAMYFGEIARIAAGHLDQGTALHPPLRSRIFAMRDSIRIATRAGLINGNPLPMGDFFAKSLDAFVTILESDGYPIISPVQMCLETLLRDIQKGDKERLKGGTNLLLRWYVLGDHNRIFDSCRKAIGVLQEGQSDTFQLLRRFVDFVRVDCEAISNAADFEKFLDQTCVFDKDVWEAVA